MLVELIQTTTRDGLRLDGTYQAPASPGAGPLDVAVCVHGTGSNFYGSTLFDAIATSLLGLGVGVLRVNTRGHDLVSTSITARGGLRQGAAYEKLDDSRHDLLAWAEWARANGGPRVGVFGHSGGAVKCLYAAAHEPGLSATHVVAVSPPRLSHSWFSAGEKAQQFQDTYQQASALVAAREPTTLLDVQVPLPMIITAAGYAEKYGPDEKYNYLRFLGRVPGRVMLTLGEIEASTHMAFRGVAEAAREAAPGVEVAVIPGADHFYTGAREALLGRINGWLVGPAPP